MEVRLGSSKAQRQIIPPFTIFAPVNSAFTRFNADIGVYPLLNRTIHSAKYGNITLLEAIIANHIIPNEALNSTLLENAIVSANRSQKLILDFIYGRTQLETLAGLNITLKGVAQNGTEVPVPPVIFVQNALVIKPDAIVAANGVVHLISNVIDPFGDAAGGFYGPTKEVVAGIESTFGPIVKLAMIYLNG